MACFKIKRVQDGRTIVYDDLPGEIVSDDFANSFAVERITGLPAKIDREFLEHLRTHNTRSMAPELLHDRLGAFVLRTRRGVVRVHQNVGVDEELIAHGVRRGT